VVAAVTAAEVEAFMAVADHLAAVGPLVGPAMAEEAMAEAAVFMVDLARVPTPAAAAHTALQVHHAA
jgi:hypothetical protein